MPQHTGTDLLTSKSRAPFLANSTHGVVKQKKECNTLCAGQKRTDFAVRWLGFLYFELPAIFSSHGAVLSISTCVK